MLAWAELNRDWDWLGLGTWGGGAGGRDFAECGVQGSG